MKLKQKWAVCLLTLIVCMGGSGLVAAAQGNATEPLKHMDAVRSTSALKAMVLAVARAGDRLVCVGERGVVLLSDDDGGTYRQAQAVPTRATLTSVAFSADGKSGVAVGHWGVVLRTSDGGNTWQRVRDDLSVDQPLLSVLTLDGQHNVAAGLWSLSLLSSDGGATWRARHLGEDGSPATESTRGGRNIYGLFRSPKGTVVGVAEQGVIYRSVNGGQDWHTVATENTGTFWAGVALKNGSLLVGGLAGKLYRSEDDGLSWSRVDAPTNSSITAIAQAPSGKVVAVGLDGLVLSSLDGGRTFVATHLSDRAALTAVMFSKSGKPLVFSEHGPVKSDALNGALTDALLHK